MIRRFYECSALMGESALQWVDETIRSCSNELGDPVHTMRMDGGFFTPTVRDSVYWLCLNPAEIPGCDEDPDQAQNSWMSRSCSTLSVRAEYPERATWVSDKAKWEAPELTLIPTLCKPGARKKQPNNPKGLQECEPGTIRRWQEDSFKYPPYHYQQQYMIHRRMPCCVCQTPARGKGC